MLYHRAVADDAAALAEMARVLRPGGILLINNPAHAWLRGVIGTSRSVVTLDNHYVHGGQGVMIAAAIAELGLDASPRVTRLGVTSLPECGTNDEVLTHHHLDIPSLVQAFRGALPQSGVDRRAAQLT